MKVYVFAKYQFNKLMEDNSINDENVESRDSIFFISIVDTQSKGGNYFKRDHNNVLNLRFDDVEHDLESSPTQKEDTRAFTEEQATKLFQFIKKHKDKETCIVHCEAGISRSGAVGTFVNGYMQGNWEEFKRLNPHISPNARVERMLNNAKYNDY